MKKLVLAGMLAIFASPAFAADDCATLATKVDEAMKASAVDDATKTKAKEAADKAKAAMDAGKADECAAGYSEALKTLGM
jgi:ATP/maltotriose-dependent transcriptional regulator MalT